MQPYIGREAWEKMGAMEALYIVGIAAYWVLLLVVVKRRTPEEA